MAERLLAAALAVASGEMKMGWRAGQAGVRLQVGDIGSGVRLAMARGCAVRRSATGVHMRRLISESVNTVDV